MHRISGKRISGKLKTSAVLAGLLLMATSFVATPAAMAQSDGCASPTISHTGEKTSDGKANLIRGTSGPDVIRGTSGPDNIAGNGGNDIICGLGGDDTIFGGAGHDTVWAGGGADSVYGGADNDTLYGGDGADRMWGGTGLDVLLGGNGNDELQGGSGNDVLHGKVGHDELVGGLGRDKLLGGHGNDELFGGAWADTYFGDEGTDYCEDPDIGEEATSCEHGNVAPQQAQPKPTPDLPSAKHTFTSCLPTGRFERLELRVPSGFRNTGFRVEVHESKVVSSDVSGALIDGAKYAPSPISQSVSDGEVRTVSFPPVYDGDYSFRVSYTQSHTGQSTNRVYLPLIHRNHKRCNPLTPAPDVPRSRQEHL